MGKKQKVKEQKIKKKAVIEDSRKNKHVFCVRKKGWLQDQKVKEGWYFWDEVGLLGPGPYATEKLAAESLDEYTKQLNAMPTGTLEEDVDVEATTIQDHIDALRMYSHKLVEVIHSHKLVEAIRTNIDLHIEGIEEKVINLIGSKENKE